MNLGTSPGYNEREREREIWHDMSEICEYNITAFNKYDVVTHSTVHCTVLKSIHENRYGTVGL